MIYNVTKKHTLVFIGIVIATSAFFHFSSQNIPDPDAFYHIRHAWLYQTQSLFNTEFPWTYFSSIRTYGADLWYGFHLFLIPFSFGDLNTGIKLAGLALTSLLLLAYARVAVREKFSLKYFWPFLFLLAVPNSLFQLLMVRPHILSLALSLLLFSAIINGSWRLTALLSAGIIFFHISFFWIIPLIALTIFIAQAIYKQINWPGYLGALGGALLGWILRPNFWEIAQLTYVQVVKLLLEKQDNLPLLFGQELFPLSLGALTQSSALFLIIWLPAIVIFAWTLYRRQFYFSKITVREQIVLWSSGALSLGFALMSLFIARRAYILWVAFGVLFIAAVYTYLISQKSYFKNAASMALLTVFLIIFPYSVYQNGFNLANRAVTPDKFQDAAVWLRDNTNPKDLVFNTHWDNFSALFFWNQENYYVGGMDPIFQYDYDAGLYWKFHHISKDDFWGLTCAEPICTTQNQENVDDVLIKDFGAQYIFVEKQRNPLLYQYLDLNPKFEKRFDNSREFIFQIKN
ncbi:MAG: hypothetical protein Q8P76_04170 [bacterium]|nr:hypothetical protein [bacterium]